MKHSFYYVVIFFFLSLFTIHVMAQDIKIQLNKFYALPVYCARVDGRRTLYERAAKTEESESQTFRYKSRFTILKKIVFLWNRIKWLEDWKHFSFHFFFFFTQLIEWTGYKQNGGKTRLDEGHLHAQLTHSKSAHC